MLPAAEESVAALQETVSPNPGIPGGPEALAMAMSGFIDVEIERDEDPAEAVGVGESEMAVDQQEPEAEDQAQPENAEPTQPKVEADPEPVATTESEPEPEPEAESEPVAEELPQVAPIAENPFADDSFEEDEEVLVDAYSPYIAKQNERSLNVTSEDLEHLKEPSADQPEESSGESFPTFQTAMAPQPPAREPLEPPLGELRDTDETRDASRGFGPESMSDDFQVTQTIREQIAITQTNIEPVMYAPQSSVVPIDPEAISCSPCEDQPCGSQSCSQQEQQEQQEQEDADAVASAAGPVDPVIGFHEQTMSPSDPDIRRQAQEIIRALKMSDQNEVAENEAAENDAVDEAPVSHEMAAAIPTDTTAIEETIQSSVNSSAVVADPSVPPVVMADATTMGLSNTEPDVEILEQIREQSQMVQGEDAAPNTLGFSDLKPEITAVDDQDLLKVEQSQDVQPDSPSEEQPLPAWSEEEPSTGQATRVDYQQLFNQLRNIDQGQG